MRVGFILSAIMHGAILAWAFVALPPADAYDVAPIQALPVELVTISDETDLSTGAIDAEPAEEPVEDAAETVEADEPSETPGEAEEPVEDTLATSETPTERTAESAAPEPAGAPEPVEEPPAEETVAALPPAEPEPAPAEEPAPEPEAAPEPQPVAPSVLPRRRPTPPPQRVEQARAQPPAERDFDADRISALLNKVQSAGGGSGGARAQAGIRDGRPAARMTLAELDALRQQIQRCWNPPVGAVGAEELAVQVHMTLNPDGSVASIVDVAARGIGQFYEAAADSARRAVLRCQPYSLPPAKYELWQEVRVTFDPRELF